MPVPATAMPSASVPVLRGSGSMVYGMFSRDCRRDQQFRERRVRRAAARDSGAGAEPVLAGLLRVPAGPVGREGHVEREGDSGLERRRHGARAAETADLLRDRRHGIDIGVGCVALLQEPQCLNRDERARPVIEAARRDAVLREHQNRLLDDGGIAGADAGGGRRRVVRADVNEEAFDARRLASRLALQRMRGDAPDDAEDRAILRDDLDALPGEHLIVPAADGAEGERAVAIDVRDEQADLVDMPGDQHARPRRVRIEARDAVAADVRPHLGGIRARVLPPDPRGGRLVPGRPRRLQQPPQKGQ